jgi:F-type H+-transporting ATPase subunit gamma
MQRADRNIDDLLENLNGTFHRLRQSGIDEALFGVRVEPPTLRTRTS